MPLQVENRSRWCYFRLGNSAASPTMQLGQGDAVALCDVTTTTASNLPGQQKVVQQTTGAVHSKCTSSVAYMQSSCGGGTASRRCAIIFALIPVDRASRGKIFRKAPFFGDGSDGWKNFVKFSRFVLEWCKPFIFCRCWICASSKFVFVNREKPPSWTLLINSEHSQWESVWICLFPWIISTTNDSKIKIWKVNELTYRYTQVF